MFKKISVPESLFDKAADLQERNFIKKWLQHRCFLVNFAKILRTTFFTEHLRTTASYNSPDFGKA